MNEAGTKKHLNFRVSYSEPCLLNKVSNSVKLNYLVIICDTECPVMWKGENNQCNILIMSVTKVLVVNKVKYD